jgi:hypothetical protein
MLSVMISGMPGYLRVKNSISLTIRSLDLLE